MRRPDFGSILWGALAATSLVAGMFFVRAADAATDDEILASRNLLFPVQGASPAALRDNFDEARPNGGPHQALDIMAPRGSLVVAVDGGRVAKLFNSKAGGITLYQFDRDEKYAYYYAHLDRYADGLREGDAITQGTVIGYVGTTGNAPPGTPHLHFSVEVLPPTKEWWKGEPVNPYPLLVEAVR